MPSNPEHSDTGSENQIPLTRIQKIIAAKMLESKRTIPTFYLRLHADLTEITKQRRDLSKTLGARIGSNDFILRAMAVGVEKFPLMAGQMNGDYIKIADTVNVGFAVAAPYGLVVPVIKDAHKKTLVQIAIESKDLTEKARSNKLKPDELTGACITLTNLGVYNIESFYAVAPPGECSILAIGRTIDEAVAMEDGIHERKLMAFTLAADHKVVNGAYAAQFLNYVSSLLADPANLIP